MTINPTANRVLIRLARLPKKSPTGLLYIPETARSALFEGEVEKTGPEVKVLRPGDYVWWTKGTGWRIDEDLLLVEESSILCRVEKEPPK